MRVDAFGGFPVGSALGPVALKVAAQLVFHSAAHPARLHRPRGLYKKRQHASRWRIGRRRSRVAVAGPVESKSGCMERGVILYIWEGTSRNRTESRYGVRRAIYRPSGSGRRPGRARALIEPQGATLAEGWLVHLNSQQDVLL